MQTPEHYEQAGSRAFYRPVAVVTAEKAVDMVTQAIRFACDRGLTDMLVNTLGLTGFPTPGTIARYALALKLVEAAGALRVAVVARPEIIDPQKIGVLVAQNRGASGDVFTNETDALAWLDART